jgi:hypothetical protein
MMDADAMHVYARAYVARRENAGAKFDKKQLRFNDIVDVGLHYAKCCNVPTMAAARCGIVDAVDACVVGSAMHIPRGSVRSMIQPWMEAGQ